MKSIFIINKFSITQIALFFSLLVLFNTPFYAQRSIEYGLKAGANYTTNTFIPGSSYGFIGGGFISFRIFDNVKIQPEILYSQKGSSGTIPEYGIKYDLSLNYIEFPLLFVLHFPVSTNININLFSGIGLSVNLSSKINQEPDEFESGIWLIPPEPSTESLLILGGGLDTKFNQMIIGLEFRYSMSFSYYKSLFTADEGWETANRVFSLIANIRF